MGYYDEDERAVDMLKARLETFIDKKVSRAVEKQILTPDEAKQLNKGIIKAIKKQKDNDWWEDQEGKKSFEILTDLLDDLIDKDEKFEHDFEEIEELLNKVEKA